MTDFSKVDWTKAIDPKRAAANVESDLYGDWYRDPWGWPELRWLETQKQFSPLFEHALRGQVTKPVPIDVPKAGFGSRPAVILGLLDRLLYQALVDRMSVTLIGDLAKGAFGWRLPPTNPKQGVYARGNFQWSNYTSELRRRAKQHSVLLETDIVSCFASIDTANVIEKVQQKQKGPFTERLESVLDGTRGIPGRRGLPQRNLASSVLANFYLRPLDDLLSTYAQSPTNEVISVRWMDDISIFGAQEGRLRRVQVELAAKMRDMGLEMNHAKTRILEGEAMRQAIHELDLKAIDYQLEAGKGPSAVDPLFAEVLSDPAGVQRPRVKFLCKRLRNNRYFDRCAQLADVAQRMPHAADDLGRLFRDAGTWSNLQSWYVSYIASDWALFDWSIAGLGTMFPTTPAPSRDLVDAVMNLLEARSRGLIVAAFVAHRLSAWCPEAARYVLIKAAERAESSLERRAFAYGALSAGADTRKVRSILGDHSDCRLYLSYLEDQHMKPPKATADYAAEHEDELHG